MKVFLTGGAGYIGSHVAHLLCSSGHDVTVYDNLSTGFEWAVPKSASFVRGDVTNLQQLESAFQNQNFEAVLHFAALTQVGESVLEPLRYHFNNTFGTVQLLQVMKNHNVKKLIFSSTAAVYGSLHSKPVLETDALAPESPYGHAKLNSEKVIQDLAVAWPDFRFSTLRYFNVAGAHPDGIIGQATLNATHVIKVACEAAAGKRTHFEIFGDDYPTPDGTCIRDYVHVWDLATAHELALNHLASSGASDIFNVGYNHGYSVREVVASVEKVSGKKLNVKIGPRRAGDLISVIANTKKIQSDLNFKPIFDNLDVICQTAFNYEKKLNHKN